MFTRSLCDMLLSSSIVIQRLNIICFFPLHNFLLNLLYNWQKIMNWTSMVFYHNYVCWVWKYVPFFKCVNRMRETMINQSSKVFFCINKASEVWKIVLATEKTALTIGQNGDQNDRQSNIIIFFYSLQNWANKRLYIGSA